VLVGLATLLREFCPSPSLVGRYGGEEFCIALVGLSETNVERLVEQIRRAIGSVRTWLPGGERTTVSIGIAMVDDPPCTLTEVVKRADDALYAAKSSGRNRFVNWKTMSPGLPRLQAATSIRPIG
jgi:diguanylate cyclase (GGDEF)-like protein